MNKEEYMVDRMYDAMYERYNEEATVSANDYYELKDKYDELLYQMRDVIYFLQQNDIAGAYEYLKSEGLV